MDDTKWIGADCGLVEKCVTGLQFKNVYVWDKAKISINSLPFFFLGGLTFDILVKAVILAF